MKFFADAQVSVEMVAMIRDLGHDCTDGSMVPPRMRDVDVLGLACDTKRLESRDVERILILCHHLEHLSDWWRV